MSASHVAVMLAQKIAAGGGSPAWVQLTPATTGLTGSSGTVTFASTTTNGSCVGTIFQLNTADNGTPSSVVGNLSGGGTVALTQRATQAVVGGTDVYYAYTVNSAAPILSITINVSGGFGWPPAMAFEASSAQYDTVAVGQDFAEAAEHDTTITTGGDDSLIVCFVNSFFGGTPASYHSGYAAQGGVADNHFVFYNTSATGAAGSKTTGWTPTGSTSSETWALSLKP